MPAAANSAKGEIWLCPITRTVPVEIGKGENSGKTITYTNVVRRWVKLGEWTGAARNFKVPVSDVTSAGGDAVAIVVQAGTEGSAVHDARRCDRRAPLKRQTKADIKNRAGESRPLRSVGGLNRTRN